MSLYTLVRLFILFFFSTLNSLGLSATTLETEFELPDTLINKVHTVSNIESLKKLKVVEETPVENGAIIYVTGYHHSGDRGGGFFMYEAHKSNPALEDGGINFKSDNLPGSWRRINYERITIAQFGALGGDMKDDTDAIQNAIDFVAKSRPPGVVHFLNGTYYVQEIVLRNGVSLQGEFRGTIIKPFPNEQGIYNDSLVRLPEGFVQQINFEGFMFFGDVDINGQKVRAPMHCFDLDANATNGGLWYSNFKNIVIDQFELDGIRLIGGTDYEENNRFHRVNQFLTFENIRVLRNSIKESVALYMYGQNGQINFINCSLSGHPDEERFGTNVWLESSSQNPNSVVKPGPQTSLINFDTCTFEHSENAFTIRGGYSINIHKSWFEGISKTFAIFDFSRGISIQNNKFSNASDKYVCYLENSTVSIVGNVFRQSSKPNFINLGKRKDLFRDQNYWEIPGTNNQTIID